MALVEGTGISKRYGGIVALDDVSVAVERGEAVGLVGPNGAGKTTLFDCLNGVRHFDSGEIRFEGRRIDRMPVYERARLGIGRTFQRLELFAGMSPREHLMVAERVHRADGRLWKDLIGRGRARTPVARVEELLVELGLDEVADDPIESLSHGHGRLVELGPRSSRTRCCCCSTSRRRGSTRARLPVSLQSCSKCGPAVRRRCSSSSTTSISSGASSNAPTCSISAR